jgi:hypothetical protein
MFKKPDSLCRRLFINTEEQFIRIYEFPKVSDGVLVAEVLNKKTAGSDEIYSTAPLQMVDTPTTDLYELKTVNGDATPEGGS